MFPIAGVLIWVSLGVLIGSLAGRLSGTYGRGYQAANIGVAVLAAVAGGSVVTFSFNGDASLRGFGFAIVVAAVTAVAGAALYRTLVHRPPTRVN